MKNKIDEIHKIIKYIDFHLRIVKIIQRNSFRIY